MNQLENQEQLDLLKREKDAVLILFGGAHCGVCQTIKPQIFDNFSLKFPGLEMVYIDCEQMQFAPPNKINTASFSRLRLSNCV